MRVFCAFGTAGMVCHLPQHRALHVWHMPKEAFASSLSLGELAGSGICARYSVCIFWCKTTGPALPFPFKVTKSEAQRYLQDLPGRGIFALFPAPANAAQEVYAQPLGRFLRTLPCGFHDFRQGAARLLRIAARHGAGMPPPFSGNSLCAAQYMKQGGPEVAAAWRETL